MFVDKVRRSERKEWDGCMGELEDGMGWMYGGVRGRNGMMN